MLRGGANSPAPTTPMHDRADRHVLVAPGALAQHPLGEEHQHQQAGRERRLHDDQRSEQQRDDLQRPAEDREAGAEQPARAPARGPRPARDAGAPRGAPPWRPSPAGRSLGCRASTPRPPPRFPAPDRPCPPTIIALRRATSRARSPALAMASYVLPVLAGSRPVHFPRSPAPIWPALRSALGVEDRTASGEGYALTFDDGPHAQGTPAVLEILARERVRATFFLVGEQVVRNPGAGARDRSTAGHEIALHCDRHRNLLRLTPCRCARTSRRAEDVDRGGAPARADRSTARPTACSTRPRCASPAARLAHAAVEPMGPRLGAARDAPSRSPRGDRRRRCRARCCCCTTPTTTRRPAPGGARPRRCRGCSRRSRARGLDGPTPA